MNIPGQKNRYLGVLQAFSLKKKCVNLAWNHESTYNTNSIFKLSGNITENSGTISKRYYKLNFYLGLKTKTKYKIKNKLKRMKWKFLWIILKRQNQRQTHRFGKLASPFELSNLLFLVFQLFLFPQLQYMNHKNLIYGKKICMFVEGWSKRYRL